MEKQRGEMNETMPVRAGEELNIGRLAEYLRSELDPGEGEISITQFPAGSSNLTYCVSISEKDYVLRRPPFGNQVKSAHDMSREFKVLSAISDSYKPAPKPLLYCSDQTIIGDEFYLMERRHGTIVRGKWPFTEAGDTGTIVAAFVSNLVSLHSVDFKSVGLDDLGRPTGYIKRQVEGWTSRYEKAKTQEWPELEEAFVWLNQDIPDEGDAALIHNDYKFDNIMLDETDPTRIAAVLDWEMATIGDPLMDLGTTLGYWMSAEAGEELMSMPFNPRFLMESVTREELVAMYADESGRDTSEIKFFYVFGTLKIAVIAQQIFYRYVNGHTSDKRFAGFNRFVGALGRIAAKAIG